MKKVNVGLIGLGDHMLQSHLKFLKEYPDVELIGAFDPNEAAFRRVNDEYGVSLDFYDDLNQLVEDVDAFIIGSPDNYHLSQLVFAIQSGKHVLCEKPLCTSVDDMRYLHANFKIAEENGLIVTSCHPRRFDPPYMWIKENMAEFEKMFGKLLSLKMDFMYHKPSSEKANLHGGSLLRDHMNHEIDYLHYLLGVAPAKVYKLVDENQRYEVAGIREDKVSFHFCGTRTLDNRIYDEKIALRYEKGEVVVHTKPFELGGAAEVRMSECGNVYFANYDKREHYMSDSCPFTDYNERFGAINRNFIDAILGKAENYLSHQDLLVNSWFSNAFVDNNVVRFVGNI